MTGGLLFTGFPCELENGREIEMIEGIAGNRDRSTKPLRTRAVAEVVQVLDVLRLEVDGDAIQSADL